MGKAYLWHRRAVLGLYALSAATFLLVPAIFGQPVDAAAYALLIVTFVLALAAAWDLYRFAQRTRALQTALDNLSDAAGALPEPGGPIEAGYRDIVDALYALLHEQTARLDARHSEQIDYYTMWVHQIKTPIAAMRLKLDGLPHGGALESELLRIERYADMALQFVRMEDLSGDLVIETGDLAQVVNGCVRKYAQLFIEKRLKVTIEGTDFTVRTDGKWLAFILEQLLSNAVKYTQRGGVTIRGVAPRTLIIEDTGIGIRPEDMPRIFEKGYTGTNGRIDRRASGLGLYMAGRVARQLSIHIEPGARPGGGTRMTLHFPRAVMAE